jgi:hypothetical protein
MLLILPRWEERGDANPPVCLPVGDTPPFLGAESDGSRRSRKLSLYRSTMVMYTLDVPCACKLMKVELVHCIAGAVRQRTFLERESNILLIARGTMPGHAALPMMVCVLPAHSVTFSSRFLY